MYQYIDPTNPQNQNPDGSHNGGYYSIPDRELESDEDFDRQINAHHQRISQELLERLQIHDHSVSGNRVTLIHTITCVRVTFQPMMVVENGRPTLGWRPVHSSEWKAFDIDQHYNDLDFEKEFRIHRDLISAYSYHRLISDWITERLAHIAPCDVPDDLGVEEQIRKNFESVKDRSDTVEQVREKLRNSNNGYAITFSRPVAIQLQARGYRVERSTDIEGDFWYRIS